MAKGEVPIPYIIALVLAIVVIGLVVYWLYFAGGDFYKTIREYSCKSKFSAFCSQWKLGGSMPNGKSSFAGPSSDTGYCPVPEGVKGNFYAPECCEFDWAVGTDVELRGACEIGAPTTTTTAPK